VAGIERTAEGGAPAIEELADRLPLDSDRQALLKIAQGDLQLLGDFPARFAVDDLALALAINSAEIDRRTPLAVALTLVDATCPVPALFLGHVAPPFARICSCQVG
jgi:hypothetical protein